MGISSKGVKKVKFHRKLLPEEATPKTLGADEQPLCRTLLLTEQSSPTSYIMCEKNNATGKIITLVCLSRRQQTLC